ncbi:hypothetical protein [Agriterribacter sp.]|uniref:hypothetical protein n=1 Tax=Agriterribacter sp. TaxID=2821509 RepID=UPI002D18030D|nr:hypothetical protein [Agriterribacter sp.]HRO46960.1 hypothetical protein [Agriterribacter sp.]HRQ18989.1 hypothetical protein [Agriterribacter sp.]
MIKLFLTLIFTLCSLLGISQNDKYYHLFIDVKKDVKTYFLTLKNPILPPLFVDPFGSPNQAKLSPNQAIIFRDSGGLYVGGKSKYYQIIPEGVKSDSLYAWNKATTVAEFGPQNDDIDLGQEISVSDTGFTIEAAQVKAQEFNFSAPESDQPVSFRALSKNEFGKMSFISHGKIDFLCDMSEQVVRRLSFNSTGKVQLKLENHCQIDTLIVKDAILNLTYNKSESPKVIFFNNVRIEDPAKPIDLNESLLPVDRTTMISFYQTNPEDFNFNYEYFLLDKGDTNGNYRLPPATILNNYKQILAVQRKYGYTDGEEKVDSEMQEYVLLRKGQIFENLIFKYLWGYGYHKLRLLYVPTFFWIFFTIFNFIVRKQLLEHTYPISHFKDYENSLNSPSTLWKRTLFKFYSFGNIFLFTGFIFWGLKLDIDKLHFKPYILAVGIIIEYVVGVFFIAVIVNRLISG